MAARRMTFEGLVKRFHERPDQLAGPKYQRMMTNDRDLRARAFAGQLASPVEGLYQISPELRADIMRHFNQLIDGRLLAEDFQKTLSGILFKTTKNYTNFFDRQLLPECSQTQVKGTRTNFCPAGGMALTYLVGSRYTDEDLFIVDPTQPSDDQIKKTMVTYINDTYLLPEVLSHDAVIVTKHALTLSFEYQIIFRLYTSLTQVLYGFDIQVCGVGFYKGHLYATGEALYGILNGVILAYPHLSSTSYLKRLIKYQSRGFDILFPQVVDYCHDHDYELILASNFLRHQIIERLKMIKLEHSRKLAQKVLSADDFCEDVFSLEYPEDPSAMQEHQREVDLENYLTQSKNHLENFYHQRATSDDNFIDQFPSASSYLAQLKQSLENPSFMDRFYYRNRYYGLVKIFRLLDQYNVNIQSVDYNPNLKEPNDYLAEDEVTPEKIEQLLVNINILRVNPYSQVDEAISFYPERISPQEWYGRYARLRTRSKSARK